MSRFIAVFHEWHVDSRGFDTVALSALDRLQAEMEAALLHRERRGFYSNDFTLVEIDDREHLPRRLTWRERLTGKIQ
jgi:hypothetical protein